MVQCKCSFLFNSSKDSPNIKACDEHVLAHIGPVYAGQHSTSGLEFFFGWDGAQILDLKSCKLPSV